MSKKKNPTNPNKYKIIVTLSNGDVLEGETPKELDSYLMGFGAKPIKSFDRITYFTIYQVVKIVGVKL